MIHLIYRKAYTRRDGNGKPLTNLTRLTRTRGRLIVQTGSEIETTQYLIRGKYAPFEFNQIPEKGRKARRGADFSELLISAALTGISKSGLGVNNLNLFSLAVGGALILSSIAGGHHLFSSPSLNVDKKA